MNLRAGNAAAVIAETAHSQSRESDRLLRLDRTTALISSICPRNRAARPERQNVEINCEAKVLWDIWLLEQRSEEDALDVVRYCLASPNYSRLTICG